MEPQQRYSAACHLDRAKQMLAGAVRQIGIAEIDLAVHWLSGCVKNGGSQYV
jgi:hypothetical protein